MSMVATRSPLTAIGMNGAGQGTRRSARLSSDGQDDNERPGKRQKVDAAQSAGSVKENGAGKRTRGKGRTGHSPRWRYIAANSGLDADFWVQFTTTRMAISSSRSARSPARSLRPGPRKWNRRPMYLSPAQVQSPAQRDQKHRSQDLRPRRMLRQKRSRKKPEQSYQAARKKMLHQRLDELNEHSKRSNRLLRNGLRAHRTMPNMTVLQVLDSVLSQ